MYTQLQSTQQISSQIVIRNLSQSQLRQIDNVVADSSGIKVCFRTKQSVTVVATNIELATMSAKLISSYKSLKVGKLQRFLNVRTGKFLFGFEVSSNK